MNNAIRELPTDYQNFIAYSRYARWMPQEGRRENWGETVERFIENICRLNLMLIELGTMSKKLVKETWLINTFLLHKYPI